MQGCSQPTCPALPRPPAAAAEYREQPTATNAALKGPILELTASAGLQDDCPFDPSAAEPRVLAAEDADALSDEAFGEYASRLYQYLQVRGAAVGVLWGRGGSRGFRRQAERASACCVTWG